MKRYTIKDLPVGEHHILSGVIPGYALTRGGMTFKKGGDRSHDVGCTCAACDGKGRHVHKDDHEVFIILQGRARMEVDGRSHDLSAGDVVVCEPGEDHHLVSDERDPCVTLYLHADGLRLARSAPAAMDMNTEGEIPRATTWTRI